MTIFRHIKNGLLYTIECVHPQKLTCAPYLVATPYHHDTKLQKRFDRYGVPRLCITLDQFVAVAVQ